MNNAVLTLDAAGVVRKVNGAAARILQRGAEDMVGRELDELFPGRNGWVVKSLDKVRSSGRTDITIDTDLIVEGSATVSVNLVTVPLTSMRDEAIGYMLMMEDITREKRLRNTMSRYMSKSVVDKLMESGEAELGGIGRDVSVLFSDIRGFTSISERLGAKETVALLNEYFTDMVDIVFAHNGVLDKYIGDMIMAVFGSVLQSAEDASNAVVVGNKMMTALHVLNRAPPRARKEETDPHRCRHQHRQRSGRQHRLAQAHGIHGDRRPGKSGRTPGRRQQVLRHLDPDLRRDLGGGQASRRHARDRPDPRSRPQHAGCDLRSARTPFRGQLPPSPGSSRCLRRRPAALPPPRLVRRRAPFP
jgi:PAS domain S-box-containing protein